ncbi:restriction endonuclease subunit S [Miltoncostaea marina]|uniref:restriction endonuclease subunit S n=1 Tax=Miltoncostaea marina TaxID=2843215 RepID=UPI002484B831|nr:restriction endonuclease subunit S [Miltoncostaea marina]
MSGLPPGWVLARLDDCCAVTLGQSPPGRSFNTEGNGFPFFQGKAEFGALKPTVRKWTTEAIRLAEEDAVLLSVRAPVGPVNLAPSDCAVGRGLAALSPLGGIDSRYLLYGMRATAHLLARQATGSTFPAVNGHQVRGHPLPMAPLVEQRRIVAAIEEQFSRLDSADGSLLAAKARLELLRSTVMGVTTREDWPWTMLGEIADVVGGVTKDSKRQLDPRFVEVPYLRVANVQRGFLDLATVTTIRVAPERAAALELLPGDVLFNEGGDRDKLGRGAVWNGELPGCIHQNHVFRARLAEGFEPKFVSLHGNTFGRRWFEKNGRQTTNLASISLGVLRRFPVPAPPLDEQRRIVDEVEARLSVIDDMLAAIDGATGRSAALRRAILECAFRGELVSQDPSDEPASVLLERIRAERAAAPPRRRRAARAPARTG